MDEPHLIGDGYTRSGYIRADRGFYGPLKFRYRPMLAAIRQEYLYLIQAANQPRGEKQTGDSVGLVTLAIDIITKQCQQLTLVQPSGKLLPVITDGVPTPTIVGILGDLEPNLLFKLRDICLGIVPSDEEPREVIPGRIEVPTTVDHGEIMRRMAQGNGAAPLPATTAAAESQREGEAAGN